MTSPEQYRTVLDEAEIDEESLTVVVVAGASRFDVATALGVDLDSEPILDRVPDDIETSAYAIGEVPGGVVAIEHTGYADPSLDALRQVSAGGRRVAVVRSNIQAHDRFGCARDGQVVFDDDEFTYIEDRSRVPDELRTLFDGVWTDLSEDAELEEYADVFATGLAMAAVVTGVGFSGADLARVAASGYYVAPSLVYVPEGS